MNPLARRRLAAYAVDCARYLGVAATTVPAGLIAARAGLGGSRRFVLLASVVPVAVSTTIAALAEVRGATYGKRKFGLALERSGGGALSMRSALARNVVKIAIPWHFGHVVAIGAMFGGFERPERSLIAASVVTYGMIGEGIWGILHKSGITVHDMIAGSRVVEAAAAPRI